MEIHIRPSAHSCLNKNESAHTAFTDPRDRTKSFFIFLFFFNNKPIPQLYAVKNTRVITACRSFNNTNYSVLNILVYPSKLPLDRWVTLNRLIT